MALQSAAKVGKKSVSSKALDTQQMCCHLVLLGLAQCKPGLTNWACSGHAQTALEGSTCDVYPAPKSTKWNSTATWLS